MFSWRGKGSDMLNETQPLVKEKIVKMSMHRAILQYIKNEKH